MNIEFLNELYFKRQEAIEVGLEPKPEKEEMLRAMTELEILDSVIASYVHFSIKSAEKEARKPLEIEILNKENWDRPYESKITDVQLEALKTFKSQIKAMSNQELDKFMKDFEKAIEK